MEKSPPSAAGRPAGPRADDHARLLELRQNADALMVGRGTLEADRMTLTVPGKSTQPLRCIVSRTGEIPPDHPVFQKPGGAIHLLVTGKPRAPEHPRASPSTTIPSPDFSKRSPPTYGVKHLHCEGGGTSDPLARGNRRHRRIPPHARRPHDFRRPASPHRHGDPRGFPAEIPGFRNQPLRAAAGIRRMFPQLPPGTSRLSERAFSSCSPESACSAASAAVAGAAVVFMELLGAVRPFEFMAFAGNPDKATARRSREKSFIAALHSHSRRKRNPQGRDRHQNPGPAVFPGIRNVSWLPAFPMMRIPLLANFDHAHLRPRRRSFRMP